MYVKVSTKYLNTGPPHSTDTYTCEVSIVLKIRDGIMKAILQFVSDIIFRVNYYFSS